MIDWRGQTFAPSLAGAATESGWLIGRRAPASRAIQLCRILGILGRDLVLRPSHYANVNGTSCILEAAHYMLGMSTIFAIYISVGPKLLLQGNWF